MKRLLALIMAALFGAAIVYLILPFVLLVLTGPFPDRGLLAGLFLAVSLEKIWAMYFRMRQRHEADKSSDWTTVSVGVACALTMYLLIGEVFLRQRGIAHPALSILGATLFVTAISFRYWAFHHLGHQWAVHLDRPLEDRDLVTDGPYGIVRHPLYTAYCLELISLPLVFNAYWALIPALCFFIPLEVHRARYEERLLRDTFGPAYDLYARRTPAFLPVPTGNAYDRSA